MSRVGFDNRIRRIQEANTAIAGLMRLKSKLLDESTTGEMPDWWSEFYDEAITNAVTCCTDTIDSFVDAVSVHDAPDESDHAGE